MEIAAKMAILTWLPNPSRVVDGNQAYNPTGRIESITILLTIPTPFKGKLLSDEKRFSTLEHISSAATGE